MYPDSFFQWLGYMAIIFGVLGLMIVMAFSVDNYAKRKEKEREAKKEEKRRNDEGSIQVALPFLALTALLVLFGCILYVKDQAGFAQLLWVLASGTAGAGCVLWIEK